ncbi:helix-turn-helix transcriptional regulator [uncultured Alistipes sp.]|jgi:DNA-binding CsgD family transcriptional regulator|uniref:helix-turn-helix transcriptional regulator n=1 Tax=Alistipes sp. TaxID=1872444 RepID=UPI0025CE61E1|nr:helix-turn-helix transcriptional regulator [uncultured Alistipes sp.]
MQQRPAIAVVTPNILMGIGMKAILEKIIPVADVELFGDFESFAESGPERFFHYFVAAQLFVTHGTFFRGSRRHKTILLCSGQPQPAYAGMHLLDVCTNEEAIVRDILRMHHGAHHHEHGLAEGMQPAAAPLSGREAEVLALIARGYMNKQIADTLQIGLTTVISHRRNIMEKLGIRSVAGLAIYAMTAGYVDADEL